MYIGHHLLNSNSNRAQKRSAISLSKSTPAKKQKEYKNEEDDAQEHSFKNTEYFEAKAAKKWKNLKQILDQLSSPQQLEGLELFICNITVLFAVSSYDSRFEAKCTAVF